MEEDYDCTWRWVLTRLRRGKRNKESQWLLDRDCVSFPASITKYSDNQLMKRKDSVWLTVIEVPAHDWLALYLWWGNILRWEYVVEQNCSLHGQEKKKKEGNRKKPQYHNLLQGTPPPNDLPNVLPLGPISQIGILPPSNSAILGQPLIHRPLENIQDANYCREIIVLLITGVHNKNLVKVITEKNWKH